MKTAEELQKELDMVCRMAEREQDYIKEFMFVEKALVAAGIVTQEKLEQAHSLYRDLKC